MDPKKLGTQELEELVDFVFDVADSVTAAVKDDGKVSIGDAPKFLKPLLGSGKAIGGINQVPKEIADLDEAEMKVIVAKVQKRFDIVDDKLEGYIENLFYSTLQLVMNVAKIYALKKNKAA